MTEVTSDFITLSVDMVVLGVIVGGFLSVMTSLQVLNAGIMERQAESVALSEYRMYNQYDFKHVRQADIVSAIFKGRGLPEIVVNTGSGTYTWSMIGAPCAYSTSAISGIIPNNVLYDASVIKSVNGEVIRYEFRKHVAGCGRE